MKTVRYTVCEGKFKSRLPAAVVMILAVMFASTAFGDVIDDSLPPDTPQAVRASTREAIQSGLDQDNVFKLTRAMLQRRFDGEQIQHAQTLMIEAHESGLPVEPLMNKAFEGMAKGVAPALIVGAMERVHSRNTFAYQQAAQLSGDKSRKSNLGRVLATAIAAGFAKQDADRITQMVRQQALTMPPDETYNLALECFYTARDVSRLGVSSEAVANMLAGALNKRFSHREMHAMRNAFMTQARQSQPQNLARRYADAIRQGKEFQEGSGGAGTSMGGRGGSGGSGSDSGGSGGHGPNGGKQ